MCAGSVAGAWSAPGRAGPAGRCLGGAAWNPQARSPRRKRSSMACASLSVAAMPRFSSLTAPRWSPKPWQGSGSEVALGGLGGVGWGSAGWLAAGGRRRTCQLAPVLHASPSHPHPSSPAPASSAPAGGTRVPPWAQSWPALPPCAAPAHGWDGWAANRGRRRFFRRRSPLGRQQRCGCARLSTSLPSPAHRPPRCAHPPPRPPRAPTAL